MKKKTVIFSGIVFSLLLSLSVPSSEGAEVGGASLEAAKKEGSLLIYHSPLLADILPLMNKFHERYPFIDMQQYRATVASLHQRITTEARAKVYKPDIFILNAIYLYLLKKDGLVRQYNVPEKEEVRKEIQLPGGYCDPIFVNTHIIAYNTRLVPPEQVPKTYQDLLDPRWKGKGKICIVDRLYEWYLGMQKFLGEEAADNYLRRLAAQNVTLRAERTQIANLLAAGEFHFAVGVYATAIEKLKANKAPVDWVGASPVVVNMPSIAIAQHAPHPQGAELFIRFVLSQEGQNVVRQLNSIPVNRYVKPLSTRLVEGLQLVAIAPESVEKFDETAKKFREFFRK